MVRLSQPENGARAVPVILQATALLALVLLPLAPATLTALTGNPVDVAVPWYLYPILAAVVLGADIEQTIELVKAITGRSRNGNGGGGNGGK